MPPSITLQLTLYFEGPFLVNDPKQIPPKTSADDPQPDHVPLRNHRGQIILPASSLRGALRSQAERIVRTLNPDRACDATAPHRACGPIYHADERRTELCLVCQLFGATGWHARVALSDFVMRETDSEMSFPQEFLAIDRFTGGGASGLKFNTLGVYQPVLTGMMHLNLDQFDEPWAVGLLALVLRDLIEGDIVLGLGAAKGYEACRARITGLDIESFEAAPKIEALTEGWHEWGTLLASEEVPDEVQLALMTAVEAFQSETRAAR